MSSASLSTLTAIHPRHHSSIAPLATPALTHVASAVTTPFAHTHSLEHGFSAYVTPCPAPSGTSTVVHVVIHTTVTIPDFARYYNIPPETFQPSYIALDDGSLISSVYSANLRVSEGWLVMGGALSVFYLRNTYRAIQYCKAVNVRNKALFYMLIASQAIGIFVSVFFVVADFSPAVDCTAAGIVKKGGVLISTTLLVPGILGTKAYRCLSNAGYVIVVLAFTRAAIIAVSGIVLAEYKGDRRITGTCETIYESPLLPLSIILQFLEASFICMCFMWAAYKSYRSPADHARLSLPLEEEDEISSIGINEKEHHRNLGSSRRGWWDYVPSSLPAQTIDGPSQTSDRSSAKDVVGRFRRWWLGEPMLPSSVFQRKPSLPGEIPLSQPPRVSSVSRASMVQTRVSIGREVEHPRASSPPPPSVMERIIRYVPRAELLRNMLTNELLYTTFITAVLLVIAIIMLVGVTQQLLLGPNNWIMLDWLIISICTMHSFSRVARRHERETWLQDSANWRSTHHAEVEDRTALRPKNSHRAWSPVSVASWRHRYRQRGSTDESDSIGRFRSPDPSNPFTASRPSRVRSASFTRTRMDLPFISRSTSVASSPSVDSVFRPPRTDHGGHGSPTVLPSPEYSPTSTSTPQSDSHTIMSNTTSAFPLSSPIMRERSDYEVGPRSCPPRHVSSSWGVEKPELPDLEQRYVECMVSNSGS